MTGLVSEASSLAVATGAPSATRARTRTDKNIFFTIVLLGGSKMVWASKRLRLESRHLSRQTSAELVSGLRSVCIGAGRDGGAVPVFYAKFAGSATAGYPPSRPVVS